MALTFHIPYRMTEEVIRWRFELQLRGSKHWWVAFTNPTAGPWKRLMGRNSTGESGEVYRFPRDEDRPDVVAVNESLSLVMIVEAKDTAESLNAKEQVQKSSAVVTKLSAALARLSTNPFWAHRARYTVIAGLLWGRAFDDDSVDVEKVFRPYRSRLQKVALVGFETTQQKDGQLSINEFQEGKSNFRKLLLP